LLQPRLIVLPLSALFRLLSASISLIRVHHLIISTLIWHSSCLGDAKAKSVDVSSAVELTRVPSVSPPFGFQFKVGKNEYAFHAKDALECTAWMKALAGQGARPSRILAETSLDLSGQSLAKFPKVHLSKQGLQTINLSSNQLVKLPEDFGSFAKLEVLDLSSNQLKSLPDAFGYLVSLKDLNLSENLLTTLPASFAMMSHLGSLTLASNKFTDLPSIIFSLSQLDTLNYSYNTVLSEAIPAEITKLAQLRHLDLSGCGIKSVPDCISALANLRVLELFKNQLTQIPPTIAHLKLLTRLALGRNKITALPDALPENLQELDITHNPINDLPNSIGSMASTYIDYMECPLAAIPHEHTAQLSSLKAFLASRASASSSASNATNVATATTNAATSSSASTTAATAPSK